MKKNTSGKSRAHVTGTLESGVYANQCGLEYIYLLKTKSSSDVKNIRWKMFDLTRHATY